MQLVIVVLAFLCAIVSAMPVNLVKRDVWAPGGAMEAFIQIKQCKKGRKKTVELNGILRV